MILEKITETTKVRKWVEIINSIVDYLSVKSNVWETTSVIGQKIYKFETPFPADSIYTVTYASIELYESDYVIKGNTIEFIEPTPEGGYPIKIRYIGGKQ